MKVVINNSVYGMTREQLNSVLDVAMKHIPFGIYAIEKDDVCELKKDRFEDKSELMKAVADYEEQGFKVYYNARMERDNECKTYREYRLRNGRNM